jgi:hypothetical protein
VLFDNPKWLWFHCLLMIYCLFFVLLRLNLREKAASSGFEITLMPFMLFTFIPPFRRFGYSRSKQRNENSIRRRLSANLPPGPLSIPIFRNWLQVGNDLNHLVLVTMAQTYGPKVILYKNQMPNSIHN